MGWQQSKPASFFLPISTSSNCLLAPDPCQDTAVLPSLRSDSRSTQPELGPDLGCSNRPGGSHPWTVERLQGWHLPLLDDPAFLPLHPLLQRTLLFSVPRSLASALVRRQSMGSLALVSRCRDESGKPRILGLIMVRPLNRRGSCWEVQHLRLAMGFADDSALDGVASSLLREAIQQAPGAVSWVASASSLDTLRLAILRQQGFQPQRTERVWRWQAPSDAELPPLPPSLKLRPLQSSTASLLWHLEQATCPAPLRQMLDRRLRICSIAVAGMAGCSSTPIATKRPPGHAGSLTIPAAAIRWN